MRTESLALKISYFQTLYQQYSRLHFTRIDDRPFAIAGLEKRLQKAFRTQGDYGIFDHGGPQRSLFHRSLLWQRAKDSPPMSPIVFPLARNVRVPSWSWMAYAGAIDYTDPPFQKADWEMKEISSPWSRGANGEVETTGHNANALLKATVRDFNVAGRREDETGLVYDTERTASDGQRTQCVILARSKEGAGRAEREKRFYVLLVARTGETTPRGEKIYRRVGAGYMLGKYITLEGLGTPGRIC